MTCCVLHNLCIDDGEMLHGNDGMLDAFQLSHNNDGAEFTISQLSESDFSEREMSTLMRELKRKAEERRTEVRNEL